MFFSPLSEVPSIGRNSPYLYSFIGFFLVSIGLAFIDSFPGIIILRFFQGRFGSPCLASGAAAVVERQQTGPITIERIGGTACRLFSRDCLLHQDDVGS